MKNGILNELIAVMKERVPQGQNLASVLADILFMGKEAVYRRLRGEVSFSIEEIATISSKLGISIDHSPNAIENYYEILNRYQQIFDYVKEDSSTEIYTASNLLPFTLYSSYEYLSKFRLCRWLYQHGQIKNSPFLIGYACRKTNRTGA